MSAALQHKLTGVGLDKVVSYRALSLFLIHISLGKVSIEPSAKLGFECMSRLTDPLRNECSLIIIIICQFWEFLHYLFCFKKARQRVNY